MPTCPSREQLGCLLAGQAAEEAAALERHVEGCAACQEALGGLTRSADAEGWRRLRQDPAEGAGLPAEEFWRRLKEGPPPSTLSGNPGRPPGAPEPPPPDGPSQSHKDTGGVAVLTPPGPAGWPQVDGYKVLGELGRGGMGVVYKARHLALNRVVALKMVLAGEHAGPDQLARFRTEAEAAARLQHANIVQVYEVGEQDGRPFLSLEYVDGGSLAQHLAGTPLSAPPAAELVETLARAAHYAHQRGVVHRDLKPANVLLHRRPTTDHTDGTDKKEIGTSLSGLSVSSVVAFLPKITDFGLARCLDSGAGVTGSATLLGTPSYMAPEQAGAKSKQVGPAADVYALGAILYECLTGRPPFRAATLLETLQQVAWDEPLPPSRLQRKVPHDLETVCLKCLRKEPHGRYPSGLELAEDLRRFRDGRPVRARRTGLLGRLWRWCRRNPLLAPTLLLAAVALLAVSVLAVLFGLVQARAAADLKSALGEAKAQRRQADQLAAKLALDSGLTLCEQGEANQGLLWLARSLELAERDGDPNLQRVARANLTGWRPQALSLAACLGHPGPVTAVAFRPDGLAVLTGCSDPSADRAEARVWDAATGGLLGPVRALPGPVTAVAFAPDGSTALAVTGNPARPPCAAHLWEPATGRTVGRPLPLRGVPTEVAFSRDGRVVLIGSSGVPGAAGEAKLWDTATGRQLGRAILLAARQGAVALSPDGRLVLAAAPDDAARFWEVDTCLPAGPLLPWMGVQVVAFSRDGRTALTAGSCQAAQLWDVATRKRLGGPLLCPAAVEAAAFSPDGLRVVTAGTDKAAQVWDVATGHPLGAPLRHDYPLYSVVFAADGRTVLTRGVSGTNRLWDADACRPLAPALITPGLDAALALGPDGRTVATGGEDGTARLWRLPAAGPAHALSALNVIQAVDVSPDGRTLLAAGMSNGAFLWDADTGRPRGEPMRHDAEVLGAAFSPDGKVVATAVRNGTARLWDAETARPIGEPLPQPMETSAVAFSPDGSVLATGGCAGAGNCGGEVRLWDLSTRQVLRVLPQRGHVRGVTFSPDGRYLVTCGDDNAAHLWEVATGSAAGQPLPHPAAVHCASFSPDGRLVATACQDGEARVWETRSGTLCGRSLRHQGAVVGVRFSADGRSLATAAADGTARLWDVDSGRPLGAPFVHAHALLAVALAPNGRSLLTGGEDRFARLWDVPAPAEGTARRLACWAQVVSGMELDERDVPCSLDAAAWLERRRHLDELGGPRRRRDGQEVDPDRREHGQPPGGAP